MYTFLSRHALIQKFKLIHTYSYSIIYCFARLTVCVCVCVYCILIFAVIIKPSHVLINVLFVFVRCVNYMWRSFYFIKNLIQKLVTFLQASDMCKQSIINFNFGPKKNFPHLGFWEARTFQMQFHNLVLSAYSTVIVIRQRQSQWVSPIILPVDYLFCCKLLTLAAFTAL